MIDRRLRIVVAAALSGVAALAADTALATRADSFSILDGDGIYMDTGITINPIAANGAPGLFGAAAGCCMGVQGAGNNNAIQDLDGIQGGSDSEKWEFVLDPGQGLTSLEFIYSRANPIMLSGFISDPLASADPAAAALGVAPVYNDGTITFNHPWRGGAITDLTFGNPGASSGQTITLSLYHPGQPGAAMSVYAFEWDAAAPIYTGDVDGDGDVDLVETTGDMLSDFDVIRNNWFNSSSPTRAMGDLNGDGIVEFDDFAEWKGAFPFPIAGSMETGFYVVPEPASLASIGVALLVLSGVLRRK
jgi:hypothetical protein